MRLFNRYLKIQRERLTAVKEEIVRKNELLSALKKEKDNVMIATKKEYGMIESEMEGKRRIVDQLNKKQRDIKAEIRNKEKVAKKLDDEIKRIIEAEMAKTKKSTGKENITPAEKIVSNDFAKNQGMLPWPTQKGLVTGKYGEHDHPDFKSVKIRNDGVYISTSKGEYARTVFKGTISRVFSIPGENYTVIIKHGMYYTLYHNLTDVRVKAGQTVETKEIIGKVYTNENTRETTLYFQVWKETERNDPELWLAH
jgi:septal ring factor EnvC (AmiA/AmiB activator)